MNLQSLFIKNTEVFEQRKRLVCQAVSLHRTLPEQVFATGYHRFLFEEFDWCMTPDFWPCLQNLASVSGDPTVLLAVLDPDPENYFFRTFGRFSWADLPTSLSASDYWDVLNVAPDSSPADAVLFNSFTVVWMPPSGDWAIWGQRRFGVCILGVRTVGVLDALSHGTWQTVDQDLNLIIDNGFWSRPVPPDYSERLLLNYQR